MKTHRINAVFLRHLYVYPRSFARVLDLVYWPLLGLFVWGFLTIYLREIGKLEFSFVTMLLGGLIFWEVFIRTQQAISISFLEEVWSRNLMNLFVSPLTHWEFIVSTILLSIGRTLIPMLLLISLAWLLYAFNIFSLGFAFLPFVLNLAIFGWTIGIFTTALILRFGRTIDVIAWSLPMVIQPISAVFYPVSVLPDWLRHIAFFLPTTHIFEGMRLILIEGKFDAS